MHDTWTWFWLFSPTHKRTEGRAPVWGSEFTSNGRRTTRGDPAETAARLHVKLRDLRGGGGGGAGACFFTAES